jgi:hypothetical protein
MAAAVRTAHLFIRILSGHKWFATMYIADGTETCLNLWPARHSSDVSITP